MRMITQFTIKIEKDLKNNALRVSQELGIPLATLTKVFYQHLIRTKKIICTTGDNQDFDMVIDQALKSAKVKDSLRTLAHYIAQHPLKK